MALKGLRIPNSRLAWNNLEYQTIHNMDLSYPLPLWNVIKENYFIERVIKGYYSPSLLSIEKRREGINLNIARSSRLKYLPFRPFSGLLKRRVYYNTLYTFPADDSELLIHLISYHYGLFPSPSPSPYPSPELKLGIANELGLIKGIRIIIKGRYKKSTRTQSEIYQFGKMPNSPTTSLSQKLFFSTKTLIKHLGSSSLHLFIVH